MPNQKGQTIMIVGVGGQGTLLASRVLGSLLINEGYDVTLSEVHGMSQRGGSVVTYVKYGEKISSPVADKGEADLILAFEELEAYRWIPYLKKDGSIIVSTQQIAPLPVVIGAMEYPKEILQKIRDKNINIISIDAAKIANDLNNIKTVNVVLMGVLSKHMGIAEDKWLKALQETVPEKFLDVNIKAFKEGINHVG